MFRLPLARRCAAAVIALSLAACSPQAAPVPITPSPGRTLPPTSTATPLPPTATLFSAPPATQAPSPLPAETATTAPPPASPGGGVSSFPDPAAFTWAPLVSGLVRPTDFADAGGGRLLVLEQPGRVRVISGGQLLPDAFLDLTARVGSSGNEQGLLGIALHPQFASNGFFYLDYTDLNGDTVVARFYAPPGALQADAASERALLNTDQPFANHNGGSLAFGPDGYLYIGMGDGGSGGDPQGNGQKLSTLLGKILRIDVDSGEPYAIPPDNPFANGESGRAEIWAYGLRNPWRFSFDRATGDLYIADVGQNAWEEVDYLPAGAPGGANFGWNIREGANPFRGEAPAGVQLIEPVAQYPHPEGCSVTGGFVYRGAALPALNGIYLYGDYCNGRIWGLLRAPDGGWQNRLLFETGTNLSSFGQDASGELYLLDQRSGSVLKLEARTP